MTDIKRYNNGYYDDCCHGGLVGCKEELDGRIVKYDDHLQSSPNSASREASDEQD